MLPSHTRGLLNVQGNSSAVFLKEQGYVFQFPGGRANSKRAKWPDQNLQGQDATFEQKKQETKNLEKARVGWFILRVSWAGKRQ